MTKACVAATCCALGVVLGAHVAAVGQNKDAAASLNKDGNAVGLMAAEGQASMREANRPAREAPPSPYPLPKGEGSDPRSQPQKVLMIGNSLTYVYDIPAILERLAADGNHKLAITRHLVGGKTLAWHWTNPAGDKMTAKEVIEKGGFDVVVLQEQSNYLKSRAGMEGFAKSAGEYAEAIRAKGMRPLFYMAYPRLKEAKLEALREGLSSFAKAVDGLGAATAPAALAFVRCEEKDPKLALIDEQTDRKYALNKTNTHQSPFGAYLAACTIYAALYHESPVGLKTHAAFDAKKEVPIEAADALLAQEIAWQTWQEYSRQHEGGGGAASASQPAGN